MFIRFGLQKRFAAQRQRQAENHKAETQAREDGIVTTLEASKIRRVVAEARQADDLDLNNRSLPVYVYLFFCNICFHITTIDFFNYFVLVCIVMLIFTIGAGTYQDTNGTLFGGIVDAIDTLILHVFDFEIIVKILSHGMSPFMFFINSEWKWNNFDLLVQVIPRAFPANDNLTILKLLRLARLAKLFRKIPQLQMIIQGLFGGLKSIGYIMVLMFMTFYIYAVAGMSFFSRNDPWHFGNLATTMISLFRLATLDNWGGMFFISYYGCYYYSDDVYIYDDDLHEGGGGVHYCRGYDDSNMYYNEDREVLETNGSIKVLATVYFFSFIFLATFCMLSLFIGAVSLSMADSMEKMNAENMQAKKSKNNKVIAKKIEEMEVLSVDRRTRASYELISKAFAGEALVPEPPLLLRDVDMMIPSSLYVWLAEKCAYIVDGGTFNNLITFVIISAGVLIGLDTMYDEESKPFVMSLLDDLIQVIFTLEVILKVIAEEFQPWNYFKNGWNCFDFSVVMGTFIINMELFGVQWGPLRGSSQLVMILRLLKLLRVLKLMKALPQLQVKVEALSKGMTAIGMVGIILFIFHFFFGVVGLEFFQLVDPIHFGELHMCMIYLFQCVTLDDWTPIMYVIIYGCSVTYDEDELDLCNPDVQPEYIIGVIYFTIFIFLGNFCLLTLFIGVVGMAMEEADDEHKEQERIFLRVAKTVQSQGIDESTLLKYREVFDSIDFTKANKIGRIELRFGLKLADVTLTDREFDMLWKKVDKDKSAAIDYAEFLEFMFDLRDQVNSWSELELRERGSGANSFMRRRSSISFRATKRKNSLKPGQGLFSGLSSSKIVPVVEEEEEEDPREEKSKERRSMDSGVAVARTRSNSVHATPSYDSETDEDEEDSLQLPDSYSAEVHAKHIAKLNEQLFKLHHKISVAHMRALKATTMPVRKELGFDEDDDSVSIAPILQMTAPMVGMYAQAPPQYVQQQQAPGSAPAGGVAMYPMGGYGPYGSLMGNNNFAASPAYGDGRSPQEHHAQGTTGDGYSAGYMSPIDRKAFGASGTPQGTPQSRSPVRCKSRVVSI
jgi:voltage-gated sodium channel